MILPEVRDPRLITVRRGGLLTEEDHALLALWAADCASHVLHLFEQQVPADHRPRDAICAARSWAAGNLGMMQARAAGGHAMGAARALKGAARALKGAARFAAYAAGQAACVGHVPEHDLGAAAYGIKAAQAARPHDPGARLAERDWQRARVPEHLSALVIEDQTRRNDICWSVFDD